MRDEIHFDQDWECIVANRDTDLFGLLQSYQPDLLLVELNGDDAECGDLHEPSFPAPRGSNFRAVPIIAALSPANGRPAGRERGTLPISSTHARRRSEDGSTAAERSEVAGLADDWAWIELEEFFG
jgi:hypothetical protein